MIKTASTEKRAEAETFATVVCKEVDDGALDRNRIIVALVMSIHYLQKYQRMVIGIDADRKAAEEGDEEKRRKIPPLAGNIIPFPGKYRVASGMRM